MSGDNVIRISQSLDAQCRALIAYHVRNQLPERKTLRHGDIALWARIRSTRSRCPDEPPLRGILAIEAGWQSSIYSGFGQLSVAAARRLADRRNLSWVQMSFLAALMSTRHRGVVNSWYGSHNSGICVAGEFGGCQDDWNRFDKGNPAEQSFLMVRRAMECLGLHVAPPLCALLDPRLTNLILLRQLEATIYATKRKKA